MLRNTTLRVSYIFLLWGLLAQSTSAQNNAIFAGGNADGFTLSCFLQASGNLIFTGGSADGFDQSRFLQVSNNALFAGGIADGVSQACFLQASQNAIFAGASGDGFEANCFVQLVANNVFGGGSADGFGLACFTMAASNAIFAGGTGDGFHLHCFALPASNNIFAGGDADGFVEACFFQPNNSLIFAGGIGDGFDFNQFLQSPIFAVELLSFDGIYDNGESWLTWITETEINNSHFELERSVDGRLFEQIAAVPGAGTTSEMQIYEYRDPVAYLALEQQKLYYRLRQVDFDGRFAYSNVVEVRLSPILNSARVFPNPVSKTLFLQLQASVNYPVSVQLFDLHGRQIRQSSFPASPGANLFQVELGDLPEGAYYFRAQFGENAHEINTFKIIILR